MKAFKCTSHTLRVSIIKAANKKEARTLFELGTGEPAWHVERLFFCGWLPEPTEADFMEPARVPSFDFGGYGHADTQPSYFF